MTGVHDLALFVIAGLLLNLTPGPDMAYIAARSAAGGFRDGAAAVLGITSGCIVHTFAAALGLSALLAASATAFEIVKWCGALYLLYAGGRLLLARPRGQRAAARDTDRASPAQTAAPADQVAVNSAGESRIASAARIFREGLLINVFNPKVALFFLAFVPQFIAADAPAKALSFLLLGALFNFNSLFVNMPVAWLSAQAGRRMRTHAQAARWLSGAVGGLFVLLAARLATLERS